MVPFGALAFDFFALERWDYSAPLENDQAQWERLAQEYLALHPKERFAYHQASGWDHHYHSHPELIHDPTIRSMHALLTPEKTRRVLEGRQTADERDLGIRAAPSIGCNLSAWVRVCYDPELEDAYNQLVEQTELEDFGCVLDSGNVGLDNPLLYGHLAGANAADLARGILARIPSLCDGFHGTMKDYDFSLGEGEWKEDEDSLSPLELASKRVIALIYVADEAAIRGKHVKLLWLDPYGKCVWSNKIKVTEFQQLVGTFLGGYSLEEAVDTWQLFDNEGSE